MSVRRREWRDPTTGAQKEAWMIDVDFTTPDGSTKRIRKVSPVQSRRGAEDYERQLRNALLDGSYSKSKEPEPQDNPTPTMAEFFPRFIDGHAKAEKLKPGTIREYRSIYGKHFASRWGSKRIDEITTQDVARLKLDLGSRTAKRVNCVLTLLSKCLNVAVDWQLIEEMPCRIRLLKQQAPDFHFYDFETFEALVDGARKTCDPRILVVVLLGGQAGLRDGEMQGLEWGDVDLKRGVITVQRAVYKGDVNVPKGGRLRRVEMTKRLREAFTALPRGLHSRRVLTRDDGTDTSHKVLRHWMMAAQRAAGQEANGHLHVLRHTFCSHLAMRAAPAKAIQELAGHANITTTMRYMHLSPAEKARTISLLDGAPSLPVHGTTAAHGPASNNNSAS